jgi:hypothetical protein
MSRNTPDGWVPDVSIFVQETCAILICFVSHDCWLLNFYFCTLSLNLNLLRWRRASYRWVRDVSLYVQEACAILIYLVPVISIYLTSILESSIKFKLVKFDGHCS